MVRVPCKTVCWPCGIVFVSVNAREARPIIGTVSQVKVCPFRVTLAQASLISANCLCYYPFGRLGISASSDVSPVMRQVGLSHPLSRPTHLVSQAAFACPLLPASGLSSQSESVLLPPVLLTEFADCLYALTQFFAQVIAGEKPADAICYKSNCL